MVVTGQLTAALREAGDGGIGNVEAAAEVIGCQMTTVLGKA